MTHLLRYLFLSYFLFLLSSSSPTALSLELGHQCLHEERSALLQLQLESMTTNSTRLGFWEPEIDCCSWKGITCNITSGHVIRLDLTSMLSAPIHSNSSLFRLRNLQRLNLAYNNFNFTPIPFPSGLDRLASLTHLNLSKSCFSGQIPLEISRLTRLVSLDLSNYLFYLDKIIPKLERPDLKTLVQNLTSLRELYLDSVNISMQSSDWGQALADALPNLSVLSLSYCGLSGPIHSSLSRLRFLSELHLDGNNFSVVVPSFLENLYHLKTLSLKYCGLHGKFRENVFRLPNLQILDVSGNTYLTGHLPDFPPNNVFRVLSLSYTNFYGEIPDSISNLKFLTKLQLYYCNFSGSIPSSLFTLPSLQYLSLYMNQLSGQLDEFPNASLSSLEILDLGGNQLKGQIPKSIAELSRLRSLYLDSNDFNGTVKFDMFLSLKNLSLLFLDGITLSFQIAKNSFRFPQFEILSLRSCNLSEFPDFLKDQNELWRLDLSTNNIHGQIPNWIWKKNLQFLNLSHNSLNSLEQPVPNLTSTSLSTLDLHSNMLQGSIPIPSPSVQFFLISANRFTGEIPESICKLSDLEVFDVSHNKLSGLIPECLGNMGTLSVLDVQGNKFHRMPQNFTNSSSLRTLNINENQIEGQVPRSLANCMKLEVLDLGRNKISDTFPYWLETLPLLKVLVLQTNKFYGPIKYPKTNYGFPKLHIMDLSFNGFTGKLPKEYFQGLQAMMLVANDGSQQPKYIGSDIGSSYYTNSVTVKNKGREMKLEKILTIFISLDLSNNKFEGEIPDVMGDLKALIVLNLSCNVLTGQIPSSIEKLTQLQSLDLSQNRLSGEIPWQLTYLTFVAVLNFSQNQLKGHIPQGNQFNTFSNASYEGNPRLCGFPLTRKCGDTNDAILLQGKDIPLKGEDSQSSSQFDWKFMLMGYGCGMVFGIIIENFIFYRKDKSFMRIFKGRQLKQGKRSKKSLRRRNE